MLVKVMGYNLDTQKTSLVIDDIVVSFNVV
jgi:hypothetical protein